MIIDNEPKTEIEPIIEINHVDMVFNMANQQLTNLKEYAIAALRHELFFKEFKALNDINIKIYPGDVYGIVGTNGSGKSTLLKIVAGVLEPTNGTCIIRGTIAPLIELGAGFDLDLTARENIYLNSALLGYSRDFVNEHMDEIIDFAEIRDFIDIPLKNYSSGMVARIAFSIATATIPDILVVDEALSVGDFLFQRKCEERINDLVQNHGTTLLFVSHSIEQVERVCKKAVWIEKGNLLTSGDVRDVCEAYRDYRGAELKPEDIKPAEILINGTADGGSDFEQIAKEGHCQIERFTPSSTGFNAINDDPWIDFAFKTPQNFFSIEIEFNAAREPGKIFYRSEVEPNYTEKNSFAPNLDNIETYARLLVFDQPILSLRFDLVEAIGPTNITSIKVKSFKTIEDAVEYQKETLPNKSVCFEMNSPSKRLQEYIKSYC